MSLSEWACVDLLAKRPDVDVHHVRVDLLVQPDALLNRLPIENPAFVACQGVEELKFAVAEADFFSSRVTRRPAVSISKSLILMIRAR